MWSSKHRIPHRSRTALLHTRWQYRSAGGEPPRYSGAAVRGISGQARADGTQTVTEVNREQRERRLISVPTLPRREMRKAAGTSRCPRIHGRYLRREGGGGAGGATAAFRRPSPNLRRQQRHTRAGTVAASTPAARTLDCGQSSPSLSGDCLRLRASRQPAALTRRQKRSPGVGSPAPPSFRQQHFTPHRQLRRA